MAFSHLIASDADRRNYFLLARFLLVLTMAAPMFLPVAVIWFGLAKVLGIITSKIVLSIIFLVIVTPVATARRLLHKDTLA